MPDELWIEVCDTVQETGSKTIPKKCKKVKWLSEEALQIAVKRREVKSKGEKERYTSWYQTVLQQYKNQTTWYWHKNRHIDQWNRKKSSEIYPHVYSQSICQKETKNIQWKIVYLINRARKTGQPHAKEWNCATILHQNVNSKWITKMSIQNELKT